MIPNENLTRRAVHTLEGVTIGNNDPWDGNRPSDVDILVGLLRSDLWVLGVADAPEFGYRVTKLWKSHKPDGVRLFRTAIDEINGPLKETVLDAIASNVRIQDIATGRVRPGKEIQELLRRSRRICEIKETWTAEADAQGILLNALSVIDTAIPEWRKILSALISVSHQSSVEAILREDTEVPDDILINEILDESDGRSHSLSVWRPYMLLHRSNLVEWLSQSDRALPSRVNDLVIEAIFDEPGKVSRADSAIWIDLVRGESSLRPAIQQAVSVVALSAGFMRSDDVGNGLIRHTFAEVRGTALDGHLTNSEMDILNSALDGLRIPRSTVKLARRLELALVNSLLVERWLPSLFLSSIGGRESSEEFLANFKRYGPRRPWGRLSVEARSGELASPRPQVDVVRALTRPRWGQWF